MSDKPRLSHNYGTVDKEYGMFLATRPPEEDGPLYMVNLMKYHEVAQYEGDAPGENISGKEADDRYNPSSVLNKIGADVMFYGDVVTNHLGDEDWDRIGIVRYATRRSFIEMQSRTDFAEKHQHKAAGMLRTILPVCRPVDESIDSHPRPAQDDLDFGWVVMVVRQAPDRNAAYAALPEATNFWVEGTIIGDERQWDTVQFINAGSEANAKAIGDKVAAGLTAGEAFVMTVRTTMDGLTA